MTGGASRTMAYVDGESGVARRTLDAGGHTREKTGVPGFPSSA